MIWKTPGSKAKKSLKELFALKDLGSGEGGFYFTFLLLNVRKV